MKRLAWLVLVPAALTGGLAHLAAVPERADQEKPSLPAAMPPGYRDWRLISVSREEGDLNDLRAILGNDTAIEAYRSDRLPFPDGTIIARLAWRHESSAENDKAFGRVQSWVAGPPVNGVQFMIKDSKRYAATGGWGFAHFDDGKPAAAPMLEACFKCHEQASRDFVFTRYSQ